MAVNKSLLKSVTDKFHAGKFDKFIHKVRFPNFKNFVENAEIDFRFPVTLVVGPNGGGKSSVLQAVWGMPLNYSVSRFWFSTPVDPIDFDPLNRPRFWYTHYISALDIQVQTRKITGNKNHGYWEPTRPAKRDGMASMPTKNSKNKPYMSPTGDRWTPVSRTPHYYNAKNEYSAFDRFFNSTSLASIDDRQSYFIRYSAKLKEVIDYNLSTYHYYGVEKVASNKMLSDHQLKSVNKILGKKYESAQYIRHKFYDKASFSPSVVFQTSGLDYSECFAGSGELAVVNFVLAMEGLQEYDLLLLDEPETSLHPGAQERLMEYLLGIVNDKKVQVIISTHSETLVKILPPEALLVLDDSSGKVASRPNPKKSTAFHRLGASSNKIKILAEDKLLQKIVERSIRRLDPEDKKRVRVEASDLGASEMLSNQLRAHIQSGARALMVIDGDQKPIADIFMKDPDCLSKQQKKQEIANLKSMGVSIVGGDRCLDDWMRWCKKRVLLLDDICPEKIYLSIVNPSHVALTDDGSTNKKFKSALRDYLRSIGDDTTPEGMAATFKHLLGTVDEASPAGQLIQKMADKIQSALPQFDD